MSFFLSFFWAGVRLESRELQQQHFLEISAYAVGLLPCCLLPAASYPNLVHAEDDVSHSQPHCHRCLASSCSHACRLGGIFFNAYCSIQISIDDEKQQQQQQQQQPLAAKEDQNGAP